LNQQLSTFPNTANLLTKTGNNVMLPSSATVVPISITAAASQSANLIEFKNSSSTIISFIDYAGRFSGQATDIVMQGSQALTSRVRNITVSTSTPSSGDGNNGDIWVKY